MSLPNTTWTRVAGGYATITQPGTGYTYTVRIGDDEPTPEQLTRTALRYASIMRERMKEHMQQHQADMHGDDADMMGHDMGDDFEDEAHDKH